jgi:hypothetical protein
VGTAFLSISQILADFKRNRIIKNNRLASDQHLRTRRRSKLEGVSIYRDRPKLETPRTKELPKVEDAPPFNTVEKPPVFWIQIFVLVDINSL